MNRNTCKTCRHWLKEANVVEGSAGKCRRFPPNNTTARVIVYDYDTCGEHPDTLAEVYSDALKNALTICAMVPQNPMDLN